MRISDWSSDVCSSDLVGLLLPDELRQRVGQREARMEAETREVRAEARLAAGDAEVGHDGEAEAAADGGAVYRRDDRLLGAEQPRRFLVAVFAGAGGGSPLPVALGACGAGPEDRKTG